MNRLQRFSITVTALAMASISTQAQEVVSTKATPYSAAVRQFADQVLAHGRDT